MKKSLKELVTPSDDKSPDDGTRSFGAFTEVKGETAKIDLEQYKTKVNDFVTKLGSKFRNFGVLAIVIIVALIVISSSVYTIAPESEGVIRRFGKYVRTTQPGLHFKLPFGIEIVNKVPVRFLCRKRIV